MSTDELLEDRQRADALRRYDVLDAPAGEAFDRITELAAHLVDVPMAAVSFLGPERQWFKSPVGFDEHKAPLDVELCRYNVQAEGVMVVEDIAEDERFSHPLRWTKGSEIRFYAGVPVIAPEGHPPGVLCVMDTEPRSPSEDTLAQLETLADMVLDVTEQRRTQEELRESKIALEQAQSIAKMGNGLWNLTTNAVSLSPEAERLLGLDPAPEHDPVTLLALVHPDDRSLIREEVERLRHGYAHDAEYRVRPRGSRSVRWLQGRARPEVNDAGEVARVVGTIVDITERKRIEQAFVESEERFQALLRSLDDVVWTADVDPDTLEQQIRYMNDAAEAVYGRSPGAFIENPNLWIETIHPDDRDRMVPRKAALTDTPAIRDEYRIVRPDGDVRWVRSSVHVIRRDDDTIRVGGIDADITARKNAEDELKREREFLQKLFDTIPVMIMVYDPERAHVDLNSEFERVLGWSTESADAKELLRACVPDPNDREEAVEFLQAPGSGWTDFTLRTRDDDEVICSWANIRLSDDTLVLIGIDLTERKQLEAQLRQAQKMETVGTLAGGIAHDFNNILHAAIVYVQMSREDVPDDSATSTFLTHAERGLQRASELVDKLLTFSRQEGTAKEESLDLAAVVRETMDLVEPSLPGHVSLRTHFDDTCSVLGDVGQLQQVVMNLMTNAVQAMESDAIDDATDPRGVLDVDVRATTLDADLADRYLHLDPGHYVRLSISDTGPGMAPSTKERIFEPFFTTKEVGEGTGLGLSVVHGIVRAHNGEITVFSERGEGTTFNVYLPCAEAPPDEDSDRAERGHGEREAKGRVLFVDDDEQVTELEAIRLRRLGYDVTTHSTGQAALQAFTAAPEAFDVVLTDYAMPEMNGLELAQELRRQGYDVPIILMSGFSAQVSEADVHEAGVASFLRKPVGSNVLNDALDDALDGGP